jgi:hypothetical protein
MYSPGDVGKEILNSHGKKTTIRKYHMSEKDIISCKKRWEKVLQDVDPSLVSQAGEHFFNPFRKGIYYYQIQSMFLLGANKWHSLSSIVCKMEEIMSIKSIRKNGVRITLWDKFRGKSSRYNAIRCKDYVGRIQENMLFFQRLTRLHPTGYKLRQVCSAVDIKREDKKGFPIGCFSYRLSTYGSVEESLPIRDYSQFTFPRNERKYVSYKFIGTIMTSTKTKEGKTDEVSQV